MPEQVHSIIREHCKEKTEFVINGKVGIASCEIWIANCCEKHRDKSRHENHVLMVKLYWSDSIKSSVGLD